MPKEVLEVLQKIVASTNIKSETKHALIKKLCEGSACCICGGFPSHEVIYKLEDASRIERYCNVYIKKVYEREQVL